MKKRILIAAAVLGFSAGAVFADWLVDFELGPVYTDYNDIRVPGDAGTKFSLDDFTQDSAVAFRFRAGWLSGDGRHWAAFLYAPLSIYSEGETGKTIDFNGKTFASGDALDAKYRFDSYRLSYRYNFYLSRDLTLGAGATAKIRDAEITLGNGTIETSKKNTGFVPLVNFHVLWEFSRPFELLVEGDALAAPQGRAEDVLIALQYRIDERFKIRAGYRFLEGGADNDEVYTFAMFHYVVVGLEGRF